MKLKSKSEEFKQIYPGIDKDARRGAQVFNKKLFDFGKLILFYKEPHNSSSTFYSCTKVKVIKKVILKTNNYLAHICYPCTKGYSSGQCHSKI